MQDEDTLNMKYICELLHVIRLGPEFINSRGHLEKMINTAEKVYHDMKENP